mmetsp:Transcript_761/g.2467  ORF Transcript_761/g.2467 Transcript_761/m.2467 type:complete len:218 (+) Transcript_761:4271-4924(+)
MKLQIRLFHPVLQFLLGFPDTGHLLCHLLALRLCLGQLGNCQVVVERGDKTLQPLELRVVGAPLHVGAPVRPQLVEHGRDLRGQDLFNLLYLSLLLFDRLEGGLLLHLVHAGASRLLDHRKDLGRFHADDLGDAPLHDQEVRVVHVELHGMKQVLHTPGLGDVAVDEVLVPSPDDDLPRDCELLTVFVAHRGAIPVRVVEDNRHRGLGGPGLPSLVN